MANLIPPRVTVHNTDGGFWLVEMRDLLSTGDNLEAIDIKVLVPRGPHDLGELTALALEAAIDRLHQVLGRIERRPIADVSAAGATP